MATSRVKTNLFLTFEIATKWQNVCYTQRCYRLISLNQPIKSPATFTRDLSCLKMAASPKTMWSQYSVLHGSISQYGVPDGFKFSISIFQ